MPTFDGDNLIITLDTPPGDQADLDATDDFYSEWKEWVLSSPQNHGYPPAFRTIGGDQLSATLDAGAYYFLRNDLGWRIRAAEKDATYYLSGNLVVEDTNLPAVIPSIGGYTIALIGLQPVTQGVEGITQIQSDVDTIIDILCNNGDIEVSPSGYPVGSKRITLYEDDGTTIRAQVLISADGLTRTRLV